MKRSDSRDRLDHALVLGGVGRVLEEAEVPVLGVVEIGEAAVDQRADEVERERGALVAAQHAPGIGTAILGGERQPVDEVAAVGRQRDVAARLEVLGARLGVLAGEAADADHPLLRAVHQHQAHLQQDLELAGDDLGRAVVEALGAVAALEQEALRRRRPRRAAPRSVSTSHEVTSGGSRDSAAVARSTSAGSG